MTHGDDKHHRASDDEAFKYNIVSQQAEIKTKVEMMHDMVQMELKAINKRLDESNAQQEKRMDGHEARIKDLEHGLGSTADRPGLFEKNRSLTKDVAKLFGIISLSGFVIWKVVSPIYDIWVNRWLPQKIARAVESQPEPKSSKLVRKAVNPNLSVHIDTHTQKN